MRKIVLPAVMLTLGLALTGCASDNSDDVTPTITQTKPSTPKPNETAKEETIALTPAKIPEKGTLKRTTKSTKDSPYALKASKRTKMVSGAYLGHGVQMTLRDKVGAPNGLTGEFIFAEYADPSTLYWHGITFGYDTPVQDLDRYTRFTWLTSRFAERSTKDKKPFRSDEFGDWYDVTHVDEGVADTSLFVVVSKDKNVPALEVRVRTGDEVKYTDQVRDKRLAEFTLSKGKQGTYKYAYANLETPMDVIVYDKEKWKETPDTGMHTTLTSGDEKVEFYNLGIIPAPTNNLIKKINKVSQHPYSEVLSPTSAILYDYIYAVEDDNEFIVATLNDKTTLGTVMTYSKTKGMTLEKAVKFFESSILTSESTGRKLVTGPLSR